MMHLFVGPTLASDPIAPTENLTLHGPAQHGDLWRLQADSETVVVIVDGLYWQCKPLGIREIANLLHRGVRILGGGSIGALRSAELVEEGMEPVGVIASWYIEGVCVADDEVAVAQSPVSPYAPLSVPLVNLRATIGSHAVRPSCHPTCVANGDLLVERARALFFCDRTLGELRRQAAKLGGGAVCEDSSCGMRRWILGGELVNQKRADALEAVRLAMRGRQYDADTASSRRLSLVGWEVELEADLWRAQLEPSRRDGLELCAAFHPRSRLALCQGRTAMRQRLLDGSSLHEIVGENHATVLQAHSAAAGVEFWPRIGVATEYAELCVGLDEVDLATGDDLAAIWREVESVHGNQLVPTAPVQAADAAAKWATVRAHLVGFNWERWTFDA